MALGAAAPQVLGSAWLAERGAGRLPREQREELKTELLRQLAGRPGVRLEAGVLDEVDRFLDSGRVSESNLSRLERRISQRLTAPAGALSARAGPAAGSSAASVVSEFSFSSALPGADGPRSARLPGGHGGAGAGPLSGAPAHSPRMPAVPEQSALPEGPIEKWSDVARYAKALEVKERVEKKEVVRAQQRKVAQELLTQIERKRDLEKARQEEERRIFEHQEAELERWKAAQATQAEEVRRRALDEKKEREAQNADTQRRRAEERQQKMLEDSQLVQRAAKELDHERELLTEKKCTSKARQVQIWQETAQNRADASELKRLRYQEERRQVEEYQQHLDQQEKRNRHIMPAIRGENAVIIGPPGGRRGQDFYTEENVMKQLREANLTADAADQEKLRSKKEQRQSNQDYLFQQIAERNRNRERALEQKRAQKTEAQAASAEYMAGERRRIEEARAKNVQHRLELERQIAAKKSTESPKLWEDLMSPAERSINQHLIKEAEDLRKQHLALTNS